MRGINTKAQLAETEAALQTAVARGSAGRRRHHGRAGDRVSLGRHQIRQGRRRSSRMSCSGRASRSRTARPSAAFSHLEGAHVGKGARVGPFARLRPGARSRRRTCNRQFRRGEGGHDRGGRQGQSSRLYRRRAGRRGRQFRRRHDHLQLRRRRQASHRYRQAGAFIGSNAALVAPVKVGDGAYVATGSVITQDVPADGLAIGARPADRQGKRAARLRDLKAASGQERSRRLNRLWAAR